MNKPLSAKSKAENDHAFFPSPRPRQGPPGSLRLGSSMSDGLPLTPRGFGRSLHISERAPGLASSGSRPSRGYGTARWFQPGAREGGAAWHQATEWLCDLERATSPLCAYVPHL